MTPNLLLLATKAVNPLKWCSSSSKFDELHFEKLPIPGIYATTPKGKKYLVAIKPKRKADVDRIFRITRNNAKSEMCGRATMDVSPDVKDLESTTTMYHQRTKAFTEDQKIKTDNVTVTVTELSRDSSTYSFTSTASRSTSANTTLSRPTISTNSSTYSLSKKSPIVSSNRTTHTVEFIMNNTGVLPHQKSPFGKACHRYVRQERVRSPKRSSSSSLEKTSISQIDMNGYKMLAKPLQVEYCSVLGRWMFSAEIKLRTDVAPVFEKKNGWGRMVKREFFLLDDGVSWVVGGAKRRALIKGESLFIADLEMGKMRRQSEKELLESKMLLEEMKGRIVVGEEEVEAYVPLLRYLDTPIGFA